MALPTPGKARRRREGSLRNASEVQYSYRDMVGNLTSDGVRTGSEFYIHSIKKNRPKITDQVFIANLVGDTKGWFGKELEWFNVDEHADSTATCRCGHVVPTSMRLAALINRMETLQHLPRWSATADRMCPKCGVTMVKQHFDFLNVHYTDVQNDIIKATGISKHLLCKIDYKGETYGPRWFDNIDHPTAGLKSPELHHHGLRYRVEPDQFKMSVGEFLKFMNGENQFADTKTISYVYYIPVVRTNGPGAKDVEYICCKGQHFLDTWNRLDILRNIVTGRHPTKLIDVYTTVFRETAMRKVTFVIDDNVYVHRHKYHDYTSLEWRDSIE